MLYRKITVNLLTKNKKIEALIFKVDEINYTYANDKNIHAAFVICVKLPIYTCETHNEITSLKNREIFIN